MIWSHTVHNWLRQRLYQQCGLLRPDLEELRRTNWCESFCELMRNRLALGALRYPGGHMHDPAAGHYDNVGSARDRLAQYLKDGNLEHLVDVANLVMLEFVKGPKGLGSHPAPEWKPSDDGHHTEVVRGKREE